MKVLSEPMNTILVSGGILNMQVLPMLNPITEKDKEDKLLTVRYKIKLILSETLSRYIMFAPD